GAEKVSPKPSAGGGSSSPPSCSRPSPPGWRRRRPFPPLRPEPHYAGGLAARPPPARRRGNRPGPGWQALARRSESDLHAGGRGLVGIEAVQLHVVADEIADLPDASAKPQAQ